ncbi:MAG TPA: hypothetical protein V6D23_05330, partial [Candidatus Obscuribacterales bacterium]
MGAITSQGPSDFTALRDLVKSSRSELQSAGGPAAGIKIPEKLNQIAAKILQDGVIDQAEINVLDELKLSNGSRSGEALDQSVDRLKAGLGKLAALDQSIAEGAFSPVAVEKLKTNIGRNLRGLQSEASALTDTLKKITDPDLRKSLEAQLSVVKLQVGFFEGLQTRLDTSSRQFVSKNIATTVSSTYDQVQQLGSQLNQGVAASPDVSARLKAIKAENQSQAANLQIVVKCLEGTPNSSATRQVYQLLASLLQGGTAPAGSRDELLVNAAREGILRPEELRALDTAIAGAQQSQQDIGALQGRLDQIADIEALGQPAENFARDTLPKDAQSAQEILSFLKNGKSGDFPAVNKLQTAEATLRKNITSLETQLKGLQAQPPTPQTQQVIALIQEKLFLLGEALADSPLNADQSQQLKIEAAALGSPGLLDLPPEAAAALEQNPKFLAAFVTGLKELKQALPPERYAAAVIQLNATAAEFLTNGNPESFDRLKGVKTLPNGFVDTLKQKADVAFVGAEIALRKEHGPVLETFELLKNTP